MELYNLEEIKNGVLRRGEVIRWAGSDASGGFSVIAADATGAVKRYPCNPMSWKPDVTPTKTLGFVECDKGWQGKVSVSPEDSTSMGQSRRAAVFGVNIGGDCSSGACKKYADIGGCTLSYDIETSMKHVREGGFGLVDEEILSIAAKCSCSKEFYSHSGDGASSSALVSAFVLFIIEHMPVWTIGWNCYTFDNECMRYWCDDKIKNIFSVTRIGAFGKPTYGSVMNIPGVYNVDVMVYMNKSLYKLPSFRLKDVAKHFKVTEKTEMPNMAVAVDAAELRLYNMNDCVVVMDIWDKERLNVTIPSLALCTASPVYDCCRYVTGTMAPLGYSSYLMSKGMAIRWGRCTEPQNYKGGYVMDPVKGLHENIVVCDFNSMYPTIVSSCNIDPHTLNLQCVEHEVEVGTVEARSNTTTVWLEGKVATFDNTVKSPICEFMTFLIIERSLHKKSSPMYASSLKVLANSLYGSIGYDKSAVYSPSCAAAITSIGRHCVRSAALSLSGDGLITLYGDTDSVMVSCAGSKEAVMRTVERKLRTMHESMSKTTLSSMKMDIEEYYKKGIMMDKKRYCMLKEDGKVKNVGISVARRDVSAICKEAAYTTINFMFKDAPQERIDGISNFVFSVTQMAVEGRFTLKDVSKYVKKDGVSGYEYISSEGKRVFVQEQNADQNSVVDVDIAVVMKAISGEIERFTVPCGMGKVSDVTRSSSVSSW